MVIYTNAFTHDDPLMGNAAIHPHTRTSFELAVVGCMTAALVTPWSPSL